MKRSRLLTIVKYPSPRIEQDNKICNEALQTNPPFMFALSFAYVADWPRAPYQARRLVL